MFDISTLANDNGTNLGKLVLQPVDYNRPTYFRDVSGTDLLAINPGNRALAVGAYTLSQGFIMNTTSLFKAVSQFDAAVSMNTATISGLEVSNTLTKGGSAVKVEETAPKLPAHFRIYDVMPSEDTNEKKGYV